MRRADPTGGREKCWQGKGLLRDLLKLAGTRPDLGRIWNALTDFYTYCADSGVAQLRRLAWTIYALPQSIIAGKGLRGAEQPVPLSPFRVALPAPPTMTRPRQLPPILGDRVARATRWNQSTRRSPSLSAA